MAGDLLLNKLESLRNELEGDLFTDNTFRLLHATDASDYREVPLAVARPKNKADIIKLIGFARENNTSLIPRTAGTSLAGQVVGSGIVADVSKYFTSVLEINPSERWIRVEPGVVLDELNKLVENHGLFFGPETSTSNRCMIGGMVGNNSCGAHSLVYGSTRDHLISLKALLSDGSEVEFSSLSTDKFEEKCRLESFEGKIYRNIREILSGRHNQDEIRKEYPDKEIERRNTGYAIDLLLDSAPFTSGGQDFNFCKLIAGSEGTLAFITEIKLNLVPLPPKEKALVCVHFDTLRGALLGNLIALKYRPAAIELMDKVVLDRTQDNIVQRKNRFFINGDPEAILFVEFAGDDREEMMSDIRRMEKALQEEGLGYHFPVLFGSDISKVWALRKAGLGVLNNIPGDHRPVSLVEDTAIHPRDLPDYIDEFKSILSQHGLSAVFYGHISTGELHMRPMLNLKDPEHLKLYRTIATEIAKLVKKYGGSLSGEHGDGRLRGEFIPLMIGENNYQLLRQIKQTWDPDNIFNPGKITDTSPMDTSLRYQPGQQVREVQTVFDFSRDLGIQRAVEKCNGSGDCRKSATIGGIMCPSYMASLDENATTRARANILREFLTHSSKDNPFDHHEIYNIMDLCLSCKGCKSECPSNIDIAKYKAEFLQHYYDANGTPLRTKAIAYFSSLNRLSSLTPRLFNFISRNSLTGGWIKRALGFAPERNIPSLSETRFTKWFREYSQNIPDHPFQRKVFLFVDEFTEFNDAHVGIAAVKLLNALGYKVEVPVHVESGRTFLSKGLVRKAKKIAVRNITLLKDLIQDDTQLIGIEPSAILTFRDEYPDLAGEKLKEAAIKLSKNCLMIDEFIMEEFQKGYVRKGQFTTSHCQVRLHGHCHQKSLASTKATREMLSLPWNYKVEEIPSGCCGMAGSFGYEKEHYDLSMKVGELVLFPEIRKLEESVIIAAPGTSCRHQIMDGTGRNARHPVEVLYEALL